MTRFVAKKYVTVNFGVNSYWYATGLRSPKASFPGLANFWGQQISYREFQIDQSINTPTNYANRQRQSGAFQMYHSNSGLTASRNWGGQCGRPK
jgi:hypothetical protein